MNHNFSSKRSSCGQWLVLLVMVSLLAAGGVSAQTVSFTNATGVVVSTSGPATPYPSEIVVGGLTGTVARVSVTLNDIVHPFPDDLDVLLVGPGGQHVMLMSDAGGGIFVGGVNLTFEANVGISLPDAGPITTGVYEPTDFGTGDALPPTAPSGPYATDLDVFAGTNPNGVWRLYVFDDNALAGGGGITAGWVLDLDSATPPTIVNQPQDQIVSPGGTAMFNVTVTGTPPFGYQWLKNSQVIVPFSAGVSSLTITNVQATDAGHYSVVITNGAAPAGIESSAAFLHVLGPLALVDPPQDLVVSPGGSAVFQVSAAGTPPLFYQWRLNGALLLDETNSMLVMNSVQATNGGSYSVTVWNGTDAQTTDQAKLLVPDSTGPPGADGFASRPAIGGAGMFQGILQGNSVGATNEPGEPLLACGGQSVWWEWIAADDGIVTLNLLGSGFDTLLGVFSGRTLTNLSLATTDDDQGGFYTSAVQFNARRGVAYQWMIDGVGNQGSGGDYTLSWRLDPTGMQAPVIVVPPQPRGVMQGSNTTLSVITESPATDTFQWLFNGVPLPGATGSSFTVTNASVTNVGLYSVSITTPSGLAVESASAPLNVGSGIDHFAADKLELCNLPPSQGAISVGLGETGWNSFPSQAEGGAGDPNPCNSPFLKTLFQQVHAEDDGLMKIDTIDSQLFDLLGVYEGALSFQTNLNVLVACDILSGPTSLPSLVEFNAQQGSNYTVVVAPLQGVGNEILKVTATLGTAPPLTNQSQCLKVPPGGSTQLQVPANNWAPPPSVQWQLNGQDLPNATNANLSLSNFDVAQSGVYSVVLSNFVDVVTNLVAEVSLSGPPMLHASESRNGQSLAVVIKGTAGEPFTLQSGIAAAGPWSTVATNTDPCFPLWYTNTDVLLESQRFFRAIQWTSPEP